MHGAAGGRRGGKRLRLDDRLRAELAICAANPLPHSILLGRPWPAPGEPLWLEQDIAKALAYADDLRLRCPTCGTREDEWGRYVDGKFVLHDPPPYKAVIVRDHGCTAKAAAEADAEAEGMPPGERGVYTVLVPSGAADA